MKIKNGIDIPMKFGIHFYVNPLFPSINSVQSRISTHTKDKRAIMAKNCLLDIIIVLNLFAFVTCFKFSIIPKIMKSSSVSSSLSFFMFSGIVEEIGTINRVNAETSIELWDGSKSEGVIFNVVANETLQSSYIGCSISLNGVCLTVIDIDSKLSTVSDKSSFHFLYLVLQFLESLNFILMYKIITKYSFGVSKETLRRSNLKVLKEGSKVNLERALKNDGRNSGHTVQGHVDCTGIILDKYFEGDSLW